MFKYEFKSRTAQRPYFRTTIAKKRKIVTFNEEQTIYNPNIFTLSVLKESGSVTLRHLANLKKGFRFKDPYERYRLRRQFNNRLPIILFKSDEEWTNRSITPTPAVQHYKTPKPSFVPSSHSPQEKRWYLCSCQRRDGLQLNCRKILMTTK